MNLKWQEVAVALFVVATLVLLKHVPIFAALPLARITGIVAFLYAIFLSLRLLQSEEAASVGGWSELRPSLAEKVGAAVLAGFSLLIVLSAIFDGSRSTADQMAFLLTLAVAFGLGAAAIAFTSLFVELRWNHRQIEHRSSLGRRTTIAWQEVVAVEAGWQTITIRAAGGQRVRFSPYGAGAAELAERARQVLTRRAWAL